MDDVFQMYRTGVTYLPSDVSYFDELLLLSPKSWNNSPETVQIVVCSMVLFNFNWEAIIITIISNFCTFAPVVCFCPVC